MKIAYFDTIAGISGDMTLGAFICAGMSIDEFRNEIAKINLKGVELEISHVEQNGISAVKFDVVVSSEQKYHRHFKDIIKIVDKSELKDKVKENAKKIFMRVAHTEAKVHNTAIEKIHFHEVGAVDSIIDIVGTAICIDKLKIEKIFSSPVKLGNGGYVESEHGKLPVPSPATIEILQGYPTVLTDIPFELTTPTGAAIIKALSSGIMTGENINIEAIGYGAGTKEIPQTPNLLRIIIGEVESQLHQDELILLETNIDNMNPEIYPYVMEKILEKGANDIFLTPIIMKKGRPAMMISALVRRDLVDHILEIIFRETTSLGVRIIPITRKMVERSIREVESKFGLVKMKVINYEGRERLIPEFEECKRIALNEKISLQQIYEILKKEFG